MFKFASDVFASILLLPAGAVAQALTLSVNCSSTEGRNSIGAALKVHQRQLGSLLY